ncbi:hypothetical protein ACJX0J_011892, partial [Zea mays]
MRQGEGDLVLPATMVAVGALQRGRGAVVVRMEAGTRARGMATEMTARGRTLLQAGLALVAPQRAAVLGFNSNDFTTFQGSCTGLSCGEIHMELTVALLCIFCSGNHLTVVPSQEIVLCIKGEQ